MEEFQEEIEQSKALRKQINLYRDDDAIKAKEKKKAKKLERQAKKEAGQNIQKKAGEEEMKNEGEEDWESVSDEESEVDDNEMVQLGELMADMKLDNQNPEDNDRQLDDLLRGIEKVKVKD